MYTCQFLILGGLFSSTAGPLLPDNIAFQPIKFNALWKSPSIESLSNDSGLQRKNSLKMAYEAFLPKLRKLSHQEPLHVRSSSTTPHESPKKVLLTSTVKRSASSSTPLTTIESGIELSDMDSLSGQPRAEYRYSN